MSNREKTEKLIYNFLNELDPSGYNTQKYKEIFGSMKNDDFDNYMKDIRDNKKSLVFFKPPFKVKETTVENNIKLGKKYGINFFSKLTIVPSDGSKSYQTPIKYLVLELPVKRLSQNLIKKINIPPHNKSIDLLTYQPTGDSKGAKVSAPELHILNAMKLNNSVIELIKFRGGDKGGFNAYNSMAMNYGSISLKTLQPYVTGVESTKTLKAYLIGMHIRASL